MNGKNKLKYVFTLIFILQVFCARSQSVQEMSVPNNIKRAFEKKYPDANKAVWKMVDKTTYEVAFEFDGISKSSTFDSKGKWQETETEVSFKELPFAVQKTIIKQFKDYAITEANEVEDVKHGNVYEVELQKGEAVYDVLLQATGKVISKTKEDDDD